MSLYYLHKIYIITKFHEQILRDNDSLFVYEALKRPRQNK